VLITFAYVLMQMLRRLGLDGTSMAKAQCDTMRLKLFMIGAHIRLRAAEKINCPE
jgi:hypothetical protein